MCQCRCEVRTRRVAIRSDRCPSERQQRPSWRPRLVPHCKYCGSMIDEKSIFCSHCGKLQKGDVQKQSMPMKKMKKKADFYSEQQKKYIQKL